METHQYLSKASLFALGDRERMAYIREQWALDEDALYGKLERKETAQGGDVWVITGATNSAGRPLEYPIADMEDRLESIQDWAFIGGKPSGAKEGAYVRGVFALAPENVRAHRRNPLAISVAQGSVEPIRQIRPTDVQLHPDGSVSVSETLAHHFLEVEHGKRLREVEEIQGQIDVLESRRVALEEGTAELVDKKNRAAFFGQWGLRTTSIKLELSFRVLRGKRSR